MPLRSTNNIVAWLRPIDVVAKVSPSPRSRLSTELLVARELAALGAPIATPATELPVIVHQRGGFDVTFWRYYPQRSTVEVTAERAVSAMAKLHASLRQLSPATKGILPMYMSELLLARSLLADQAGVPALKPDERGSLAKTFDRLQDRLNELAPADRFIVLHGSPHPYNVLLVDDEPLFIDFETTCTGPLEWDVAHLDSGVDALFGCSIHPELLWVCRNMVSVTTAVLCAAQIDRGDMREHFEHHLAHSLDIDRNR